MAQKKGVAKPRKFDKDSFTREAIDEYSTAAGLDAGQVDLLKRSINTSYLDLAERLDVPVNTVKSRLARAREAVGKAREAAKEAAKTAGQ